VPVALDGERMDMITLIGKINEIAGANVSAVSIRSKTAGRYQSRARYTKRRAALTLIMAQSRAGGPHSRADTAHFKYGIELKYAEIIYNGLWYGPLRESLDAFINKDPRGGSAVSCG